MRCISVLPLLALVTALLCVAGAMGYALARFRHRDDLLQAQMRGVQVARRILGYRE
jgi:hypothetical protein